jgi:hypothetical protein
MERLVAAGRLPATRLRIPLGRRAKGPSTGCGAPRASRTGKITATDTPDEQAVHAFARRKSAGHLCRQSRHGGDTDDRSFDPSTKQAERATTEKFTRVDAPTTASVCSSAANDDSARLA